jgi:biotin transport system permease protein
VIGLYRAGDSPLHKLGPGVKLLAVLLAVTALSIWGNNPLVWAVALILGFALFMVAFGSIGFFFKNLWTLRYLVLIGLIPQLIFEGVGPAINNTARLVAGILVAILFSLTTPQSKIIDAVERAATPLGRLGIRPPTIGLSISLALRAIPMLMQFSAGIMESQRARGHKPSALTATVPLLVAALKYADDMSEALAARGVEV